MTNYKEIIKMNANGFSMRQIANSLNCHRNTVSRCLQRANEEQITVPLDPDLTNAELHEILHPKKFQRDETFVLPNFVQMDEDLKKPNMTLTLLWHRYASECRSSNLKFYQQTQYCALYRRYRQKNSVTLRFDHQPGEVLEIDWAGDALYIFEPITEQRIKVSLFVASLSFSGYFYAEGFTNERVQNWITANVHALEHFGGVPLILKPDNTKTAVIKADKYEPTLQKAYQEMAEYYHTVIIPTRVKKPKDKPMAEGTVGFVTRRIIADLQDKQFFSLDEINTAIWERMDALNAGKFAKKPGSRAILFEEVEKHKLLPLPEDPFIFYQQKAATVAPDFHIQFDKSFYSVPYNFIRCNVLVKATAFEIKVIEENKGLIATHSRSLHPGMRITNPNHLPERARAYSSWSRETFLNQASLIGNNTYEIITHILNSREFEVQTYRSCVGVLSLRKKYGDSLLEEACKRALDIGVFSRKGIRTILTVLNDELEAAESNSVDTPQDDENTLSQFYCCHDTSVEEVGYGKN